MKKINISYLYLSIVLITVCTLFFLYQDKNFNLKNKQTDNMPGEIHQKGYQYISPLLECASPSNLDKSKLEENLKSIINNNKKEHNITSASLYLRDLNNGFWLGINENEKFTPASLLKVPLMIAYLKLGESNSNLLNTKLKAESAENLMEQNIKPLHQLIIGQEYSIIKIIQNMIEYSDNIASNTLLANIKAIDLENIYLDLNITPPNETDIENYMSVKQYSSFFRILYNASYLNKKMSEEALKILSLSQYNKGLRANIPANIVIAHKFGERSFANTYQLHDCGIIYKKNNPYLLCIMTRGADFNDMSKTIQELSNAVYQEFN